jgi:hypothetical protein
VLSLRCPSAYNTLLGDFVFHLILRVIRVRALVPRISFFGPAVPSSYSSSGFGPSNLSLQASSAFELFEFGLWSLESFPLGQQCLRVIRVRAPVPRIFLFGPAVPSNYSTSASGTSDLFLQASSASVLFEYGHQFLKLSSSGQQRLSFTRAWVLDPSNRIFWPSALLFYSGSDPSNLYFGLSTLSAQNTQILVAIYQFRCRMSNTKVSPRFATPDGPIFVSSALCRVTLHTFGMKSAPMDASGASH